MKTFTDIEQSKKLAEILPLESADMAYLKIPNSSAQGYNFSDSPYFASLIAHKENKLPCWSLAALLGVLECPTLTQDKIGDGKTGWMVSTYPNGCRYDSNWYDNPIDACYEMIIKLHELEML